MVTKSDVEQLKNKYEQEMAKEHAEKLAKEKAEKRKVAEEKFIQSQKSMDNILLSGIDSWKSTIVSMLGDKATDKDVLLDLVALLVFRDDNKTNVKIKQYIESLGRKYSK